ncbi:hypothetical protein [Aliagarivorans marinus]|uniref:hypothetical protein n=1 Tax=Aliagarivorans marinus TaxID=561965 RepID=UPI0012FC437A|nr:hypothetical protein [Aliagarivorans marinus]
MSKNTAKEMVKPSRVTGRETARNTTEIEHAKLTVYHRGKASVFAIKRSFRSKQHGEQSSHPSLA